MLPILGEKFDVVHSVGSTAIVPEGLPSWYRAAPSLIEEELQRLYSKATLVVARSGMNTVSECAFFSLSLVTIPIPYTHQEVNARWLEQKNAAIVLAQPTLTGGILAKEIIQLVNNSSLRVEIGDALGRLLPPASAKTLQPLINCV